MSAIAGLINWDGAPAVPVVRRAIAALAPHGRDGQAIWDGGEVALAYRKTILFAEDRGDHQPLSGGGGRFRMVADIRLDNREALAPLLGFDAEQARLRPDSAYVMAAFEKWSTRCVDHLIGSFAFAVWDQAERRLFLARDHIGSRPLHYWRTGRQCFFATMPSALFTNPDVPREIDEDDFALHLGVLPRERDATLYRDIVKVPVGHTVTIDAEGVRLDRYWVVEDLPPLVLKSDGAYVEAFREIFEEAVRCRLRGLHPIGSHLSAGMDCSSVTSVAAGILAGRNQRLTAFTSVPPKGWTQAPVRGQLADEGPLAAQVAARFPNIDHVLIHGSGRWSFEALDRHAHYYEQPRGDVSNAAWWETLHLDARRRGVRVMLMGGLGNLTISYDGLSLLGTLLRQGRFLSLARHWPGLRAGGMGGRHFLRRVIGPLVPSPLVDSILRLNGRPSAGGSRLSVFNPEAIRQRGLDELERTSPANAAASFRADRRAIWARLSRYDMSSVTGGMLAAADLDMRDPTSDQRVMRFCRSIPEEQFLNRGRSRWLVRRVMGDILPPALMAETRRGRQAADWCDVAASASSEIVEELDRMARNATTASLIDTGRLRDLAGDWPVAAILASPLSQNERVGLLSAVARGRFLRRFQGGNE